jgi:hypothetical protein
MIAHWQDIFFIIPGSLTWLPGLKIKIGKSIFGGNDHYKENELP